MEQTLRERLAAQVDIVPFTPLAPHAARGGLFFVDAAEDIVEVALAIAENRTADVESLVATRKLRRPEADELARFEREPDSTSFRFIIVQPFVLAQSVT